MASPGFFAAAVVTDEAVLKKTKQINLENFIVQALEKKILKPNKECEKLSNWELKDRYSILYDYLKKIGVIKSNINWKSWFAGDYAYSIDQTKISVSQLKSILSKEKIPNKLKCFEINIKSLSDFFKNYEYKAIDQVKIFHAGKNKSRRRSKKTRKTIKK